jgi:hypothetical protein
MPNTPSRITLLLTFFLVLSGCEGLALHDARLKDTPEAYETFLTEYPESTEATTLHQRIDELRFEAAVEEGTAAAFRAYLSKHPQGTSALQAQTAEEQAAFTEAAATGTAATLEAYLEAHPKGASVETAKGLLDRILYRDRVGVHDLRVEQVNLGANPDGPLDGWGVFANIVNEGRRTLSLIEIKVDLLDAAGTATSPENTWWAVTPDLGAYPTPEAMKPALAPGASRAFRWTTGATPEDWSKKVALRVSEVRFEY